MMKRILDALFTAVVLVLAIPTILILISWNAIPGDNLYPLKSGLENIVLLVFSGTPLVPKVSMKFTDQRLSEATKLLDKKGSTVGYSLLVANARQTQSYITQKSDVRSGIQFSKNIDGYKKEIEKKKVELEGEIQSGSVPVSISTPFPSVTFVPASQSVSVKVPEASISPVTGQEVTINVPQTVVITHENPVEVLKKLDDTENQLNVIQQEVERESGRGNSGERGQGHQGD